MEQHFLIKLDQEEWLLPLFIIPFANSLHKWNLLKRSRALNQFVKMGQQILVGPVWPIRVGHLQRWSWIVWLDRTETDLSIWLLTKITRIFGIMESNQYVIKEKKKCNRAQFFILLENQKVCRIWSALWNKIDLFVRDRPNLQLSNVKMSNVVVYSGQCAQLHLASSQACHFKWRKQMYQLNVIGLKIPTGGRQTSWLYASMTEELN